MDVGDEKQVEKQKRRGKSAANFDNEAWHKVLQTFEGRYVINCILEDMARPFAGSFHADNSRLTDFREGERNVGNKIIARAFGSGRSRFFTVMREEHEQRKERHGNG